MKRIRGFSLLEILVAFTVLALSLGVLMRIFSGSLRNADLTRDQAQATMLAQSLLAGAGVETPLVAGETTGTEADKFHWQRRAEPYNEPSHQAAATSSALPPQMDLWLIRARVTWAGAAKDTPRWVAVETLRLQKVSQP